MIDVAKMGGVRETNWAGNVTFGAARFHRPASVAELCDIVGSAEKVRALGTRHSFNDIADTTGDLVSVAGLPPVIDVDSEQGTVRVSAGLRYGEVAPRLHAAGWALPNLGSLPHISIAGACATGTHGSGDLNGNLATAIVGLELVTASGDIVDRDDVAACAVGLGALGVVTHLTLRLRSTFDIGQYVYDGVPVPSDPAGVEELFGAGYSVSLFTDWSGHSQAWVKGPHGQPAPRWLGGTLADGPRHPIPGMPTGNCTQQLGVKGPWYERLPHFRLEFTPSAGDELQSEYLVPRVRAVEALAAIDAIADRVAPVLQISELRTVAADGLWLSTAYGRDSLAIHFTWIRDADAVLPVVAAVEEALRPVEPRPHWGKVFGVPGAVLMDHYERAGDFAALARDLDPHAKFRNPYLDAILV
jgi:alditol oxidase